MGLAFVVVVSGCQQGSTPNATGSASGLVTQTKEAVPAATIAVNVPADAADVRPDTVVTVAATRGTLQDVIVQGPNGPVSGELSGDKTSWVATSALGLGATYTVTSSAVNADGQATPLSSSFSTLSARDTEEATITPAVDLGTVGVGMPIVVTFDSAPLDKAAAERKLTVTTSTPIEGAWRWVGDKQVVWRPAQYWPTGTKVDVTADMTGVEFARNVWGTTTEPVHFEIGRSQISVIDIAGYTMQVKQDGNVVRDIPVSNGQGATGKYATRTGTKVIMTRERTHRMTAPGLGEDDPGYYNMMVSYALRLTNSGEFLHAAPWSVGSQGRRNVSHGCTNMSTANAKWMMENSLIGDPVEYINGQRPMTIDNGWGYWNMSFEEWKTGSALYQAPAADPAPAADAQTPSGSATSGSASQSPSASSTATPSSTSATSTASPTGNA